MTTFIINPGTEARAGHTLANAVKVANCLCRDVSVPRSAIKRNASADRKGGFYGFVLKHQDRTIEIDIPGDDPKTTLKGRPFESRRLYVDGSSWLYGYAVSIIASKLEGDE